MYYDHWLIKRIPVCAHNQCWALSWLADSLYWVALLTNSLYSISLLTDSLCLIFFLADSLYFISLLADSQSVLSLLAGWQSVLDLAGWQSVFDLLAGWQSVLDLFAGWQFVLVLLANSSCAKNRVLIFMCSSCLEKANYLPDWPTAPHCFQCTLPLTSANNFFSLESKDWSYFVWELATCAQMTFCDLALKRLWAHLWIWWKD